MDNKTTLVKCISLIYAERLLGKEVKNAHLIEEILESDIAANTGGDAYGEIISGLAHTVKWLLDFSGEPNLLAVVQRIALIAGQEKHIVSIFEDTFNRELKEHDIKSFIRTVISELGETLSTIELRKKANEFRKECYKESDFGKLTALASSFKDTLETYRTGRNKSPLDAFSILDVNDPDSLKRALKRSLEQISTEGIMRLGQAGLNEMFGVEGGLRRGNMYGIGALSHNGKSLSLKTWPLQVVRNNKPFLFDPKKKPLAIYFSFEDSNEKTIQEQYKYLYEMEHQKAISVKALVDNGELTVDKMQTYITDTFRKFGWNYVYIHGVGERTTYVDLINVCEEYKRQGYEVILAAIDYPDLMSRKFCSGDRDEQKTTSLIRNLRQYFESEMITSIIAHQLSDKAQELAREGQEYLARDVAERGMWKGCRTLHTELDVEIVQHIVRVPGQIDHMTYMRGKHRGLIEPTPNEKKFVCYPFQPFGGLGEDLDKHRFTRKIPRGGGGEFNLDPEWTID